MTVLQKFSEGSLVGDLVDLGRAGTHLCHGSNSIVDVSDYQALAPYLAALTTESLTQVLTKTPKKLRSQFLTRAKELAGAGQLTHPPESRRLGILGSKELAEPLITALSGRCGAIYIDFQVRHLRLKPATRVISLSSWQDVANHGLDLVVVAANTIEPDRAMLEYLRLSEVPFLVVQSHQDWATVGPLVVQPCSPCHMCRDLYLSDSYSVWPALALALAERPALPTPEKTAWAVANATLYAAWFLDSGDTRLVGHAVHASNTGPRRFSWQAHPDCACQRRTPSAPREVRTLRHPR